MDKVVHIARILLGLVFLVFGLNGFYTFIPVPEFHPFMSILVSSGYIYAVKSIEIVGGALLLSNRYVPLGLALLAPDVVNILLYHLLLDHRNWLIAPVLAVLLGFLIWAYRGHFEGLLTKKSSYFHMTCK